MDHIDDEDVRRKAMEEAAERGDPYSTVEVNARYTIGVVPSPGGDCEQVLLTFIINGQPPSQGLAMPADMARTLGIQLIEASAVADGYLKGVSDDDDQGPEKTPNAPSSESAH